MSTLNSIDCTVGCFSKWGYSVINKANSAELQMCVAEATIVSMVSSYGIVLYVLVFKPGKVLVRNVVLLNTLIASYS